MACMQTEDFPSLEHHLPNGIGPTLLDELGDAVAAWHAAAPPVHGDVGAAVHVVAEGTAHAAQAAGLPAAAVQEWLAGVLHALAARADWSRERAAGGFVRCGHGALHLGNVCLRHGKLALLASPERDDEDAAAVDVGYDLALLLMDLDVRAGRPAANRVLNRYVARTGDWSLVAGLPSFLSLRAMAHAGAEAGRGRPAEAGRYLAAAAAYLRPPPPAVLAVGGLPGSGKSTLARALAPALGAAPGALLLRSDEVRKRRHGAAPEQRLPASTYAEPASRQVMAELLRAVAGTAAAGHAVIADATFRDVADREAVALAAGTVPFLGAWLHAPLDVLERRVASRRADASDADVAVLRGAARSDAGAGDWLAVDAVDAAAALAAVREHLATAS